MSLDPMFNMPLSPSWSALKALLQKAPQAFGAMTVGGAIIRMPLTIVSYYLSYAAVEKYQKDVKAKLARQKDKLAETKEKMKKKVLDRKKQKGGWRTEVFEVGMRNAEAQSSVHCPITEGRGQMPEDRNLKPEGGRRKSER